ncbi:hypothetical protein [Paenibacillus sp. B01]|uniref:hypothetical protein n=1 Tax=Paenibacillus sp. B01 TaxID=2660554 RepID=UPI001E55F8B6|nr:hypothetical protein [Paenibacillus sp. B01]
MNISHRRKKNAPVRLAAAALSLALLLPLGLPPVRAEQAQPPDATSAAAEPSAEHGAAAMRERHYAAYLAEHEEAKAPGGEIVLQAAQASRWEGEGFRQLQDYEGMDGVSLLTGESGAAEWTFDVKEEGLYRISLLYYPIEGKSSAIERALSIDGERPFREAGFLQFDRIWDNVQDQVQRDNQDNDLRPNQGEAPRWSEAPFADSDGYENEPFQFYFSAGTHTLRLESTREPMVIRQLRLHQLPSPPTYSEWIAEQESSGRAATSGRLVTVQGEAASAKSSPTLYPVSERASAAVTPYSSSKIRINAIGGYNWRIPNQWLEWEIDVPETGLYRIAFKSKQNFVRGIYSTRRLTIDGVVPFREMENVAFRYKSGYRIDVLGRRGAVSVLPGEGNAHAEADRLARRVRSAHPRGRGQPVQPQRGVPQHSDDHGQYAGPVPRLSGRPQDSRLDGVAAGRARPAAGRLRPHRRAVGRLGRPGGAAGYDGGAARVDDRRARYDSEAAGRLQDQYRRSRHLGAEGARAAAADRRAVRRFRGRRASPQRNGLRREAEA